MGNIRIRWTRWLRVPGHEFGLDFTAAENRALVAFLKARL